MDALGEKIVYTDDLLWHLSNVGVAVIVATFLYTLPGSHSLNLGVFSLNPFYLPFCSQLHTPAGQESTSGNGIPVPTINNTGRRTLCPER